MKPLQLILLLGIITLGCKEEEGPASLPPFEQRNIPVAEKIQISISEAYFSALELEDSLVDYFREVYSARNYAPIWINDTMMTEFGERMQNVLRKNEQLGIPAGRHTFRAGGNYIQQELLTTYTFASVLHDLKYGIIDYEQKKCKERKMLPASEISNCLDFDQKQDLRYQLLKCGPPDSSYRFFGRSLIAFMDNFEMDTSTFDVHSVKKDTTEAISRAVKALVSKGHLTSSNDTTGFHEVLKQFQVMNGLKPDGIIGTFTSMALNESTVRKRDRIILAMDKIRGRKSYPKKYIHINIPEYKLRFYVNDSLKSEHKIIVGKQTNETPELTSKLQRIIAYPYWNVPYSISSKEILPMAKRNPNYFAKHNYKVYHKGALVNPLTVDWKKIRQNAFPYKVVQDPGPLNSLGIIKFDFPNPHSVYFHDTPSKSLFNTDIRAYSHGCIRTQYPIELARHILKRDSAHHKGNKVVADSLDNIIARGNHLVIKLLDPIPIFVEYITVARKGEDMVMHLDIYGRDEEYLKIMNDKR